MLEGFLILDRVSHLADFIPITLLLRFVSLSLEVTQLAGSHCTVLREMLCPYTGYTVLRDAVSLHWVTVPREMLCPYTGYTLSSERCRVLTLVIHCPQRDAVSLHWLYTDLREILCRYTGYTVLREMPYPYTGYTVLRE